jgi:autotransporter-associated beta strand protein
MVVQMIFGVMLITGVRGGPPGTGDTAYFRDIGLVDEAQTIDLDQDVKVQVITCVATGNRDITINTSNGSTLTFESGNDITGARGITLTFGEDIFFEADHFDVQREGQQVIFNGNISPAPGHVGNKYLNVSDVGIVTLGGSNAFENTTAAVRNNNGGEIVAGNLNALGYGPFRNYATGGTLSLAASATITGDTVIGSGMNIRTKGSGAGDVTLTIGDDVTGDRVTVQPAADGSTGHLYIRLTDTAGSHNAEWTLADYSTLVFAHESGQCTWGSSASGAISAISGVGDVLFDGAGVTYIYSTNDYTGGTTIRAGLVKISINNSFPTDGDMTVESPGTLDVNGQVQTVAGLAGNGTVDLPKVDPGTLTVTGTLAPGLSVGTLSVTGKGEFVLTTSSTSIFELDTIAGTSDLVTFDDSDGNLTLGGTLSIENLGGIEEGDYTLFNLSGGTVSGSFSDILMPRGFAGTVDTSSGDVVITVTQIAILGTTIIIR